MVEESLIIGVALERRQLDGPWGGIAWRPIAVFPEPPDVAPWTSLGAAGAIARYYAGPVALHLYSTDTANYRDNLETGEPRLWVVMRPDGGEPPVEIALVTADPAEGEASTEAGTNVVETIAMPAAIAGWVADFSRRHHVERPVIKRRRDRAEPDISWRDRPAKGERGGEES